jgi:hypothetical protein
MSNELLKCYYSESTKIYQTMCVETINFLRALDCHDYDRAQKAMDVLDGAHERLDTIRKTVEIQYKQVISVH